MGDDVVTLVVLGVCVLAGLGSALSGVVAALRGARTVVVGGLLLAAAAVAGIGLAPSWPVFFGAIGLYGLALGAVDAAMNMLGIDVERAHGRSLLASFYAANAAGECSARSRSRAARWPVSASRSRSRWRRCSSPRARSGSRCSCPTAAVPSRVPSSRTPRSGTLWSGCRRERRRGPGRRRPGRPGRPGRRGHAGTVTWVAAGTIALLGAGMLAFPSRTPPCRAGARRSCATSSRRARRRPAGLRGVPGGAHRVAARRGRPGRAPRPGPGRAAGRHARRPRVRRGGGRPGLARRRARPRGDRPRARRRRTARVLGGRGPGAGRPSRRAAPGRRGGGLRGRGDGHRPRGRAAQRLHLCGRRAAACSPASSRPRTTSGSGSSCWPCSQPSRRSSRARSDPPAPSWRP